MERDFRCQLWTVRVPDMASSEHRLCVSERACVRGARCFHLGFWQFAGSSLKPSRLTTPLRNGPRQLGAGEWRGLCALISCQAPQMELARPGEETAGPRRALGWPASRRTTATNRGQSTSRSRDHSFSLTVRCRLQETVRTSTGTGKFWIVYWRWLACIERKKRDLNKTSEQIKQTMSNSTVKRGLPDPHQD